MFDEMSPADGQAKIVPVVLCGGAGTRLWPVSRAARPKQFSDFWGTETLFQKTLGRFEGPQFAPPLLLANVHHKAIAVDQARRVQGPPPHMIFEPEARNTAPAVLAAAVHLAKTTPDVVMLVSPSDHQLGQDAFLWKAIQIAADRAQAGAIVLFGVTPTGPETSYGYLQAEPETKTNGTTLPLRHFVEKPERALAQALLCEGGCFWNSGIFCFTPRTLIEAFRTLAPNFIAPVTRAVEAATGSKNAISLDPDAWSEVPSLSLDYAIMEQASNLEVMPLQSTWSDLGGWQSVWDALPKDRLGNAIGSNSEAIDCEGSLLRSESENLELVGLGLKNIVAVATEDAVLIADRRTAGRTGEAVARLVQRGASQAKTFARDERPWGYFEVLTAGHRFQVKRLVVKPGEALSLQSHVHRAEHWVVVEGTAHVTVGEAERLLCENQSVYIPLGAVHRLENPGKTQLSLIEVQTGAYLGEDDIHRVEDRYARQ